MKDTFEHYKSLGLEPGASADRVRQAHLQLSHFYDPVRYVGGDAEHVVRADLKRKEIEAAYQEIRRFLPELRGDPNPSPSAFKQDRDINEAVQKPSTDVSKTVIGLGT